MPTRLRKFAFVVDRAAVAIATISISLLLNPELSLGQESAQSSQSVRMESLSELYSVESDLSELEQIEVLQKLETIDQPYGISIPGTYSGDSTGWPLVPGVNEPYPMPGIDPVYGPQIRPIDIIQTIEELEELSDDKNLRDLLESLRSAQEGGCGTSASVFHGLWSELSWKYRNDVAKSGSLRKHLNSSEKRDLQETFKLYDESCLISGIDRVPSEVSRVSGVLEIQGRLPTPYCSATLISPNTVITSRHCFVNPKSGSYAAGCEAIASPGVAVRFLNDLATHYRIVKLSTSCAKMKKPFSVLDDYVEATLDRPVTGVTPASYLGGGDPSPGTFFWTIGVSSYALESYEAASEKLPLSIVRHAPISTCAILTASDRCILHSCQTAPGTSGAGLLQLDEEGKVSFLGLHAGSSELAAQCSDETFNVRSANFALRL